MRMKSVKKSRNLRDAVNEFLPFKKVQKVRERTLNDYKKYIFPFVEQSGDSLDIDILKAEILDYFAAIPVTAPPDTITPKGK